MTRAVMGSVGSSPPTRPFARVAKAGAACAFTLMVCIAPSAAHADETLPLPLSGAAYRVAQQAYAAYNAHRYSESIGLAREAIRQRPDVASLRVLLANAQAASGQRTDARRTLSDAIAQLGAQRALVERRRQIDVLIASGASGAGGEASDLSPRATKSARRAYAAYADKDYDAAIEAAREAIADAPDVERLRYLLIDALVASGQDEPAYAAARDSAERFGDSEALRTRRTYIGARLGQQASIDAAAALERGDPGDAARLAQQAVTYAPDRSGFRMQWIDILFAEGDIAGVEAAAGGAIAQNRDDPLAWALRGYARAAQGKPDADADFTQVLAMTSAASQAQAAPAATADASSDADATAKRKTHDAREARLIVADVYLAQHRTADAQNALQPLTAQHDDTDAAIALRRQRLARLNGQRDTQNPAAGQLAASSTSATSRASAASTTLDPHARPVLDCRSSEYGAACDVYAADPGFALARQSRDASQRGDRRAAVDYARQASAAVPDDPQYRLALIDALAANHDDAEAAREAHALIDAGLLDGMSDLQAAFIAQRAGDTTLAFERFQQADRNGELPRTSLADAGYAGIQTHHNREGARYLERAIDAGTDPVGDEPAVSPEALHDERAAHSEATRNWGVSASVSYRNGGGQQAGFVSNPTPGIANNWQAGTEAYWRPFGSLGERMFEVYARGYDSFGVKGDNPSGIETLEAAIGARVKPFRSVNAVFAFERILPIGSAVQGDWLARAAWSGGFGTERRLDVPSWWTGVAYGEAGHYIQQSTNYATANVRLGRTYRLDSVDPNLTVFPHLVVGADYDSTISHSVPVGIGVGVATRYWFRGGPYDTERSYVDLSVQYRLKVAGDDRARGVFFGAVFSY
ncbi:bacteriophage N4 adsorption protein A [Paraburkholderia sp.]|uniref:bacteriophage N4 adsorption protein A n=1 Tax=Paraburkholderia sp. TaxID=1926495 RepID=UPI0023A3A00E|nr:bacteriophage N4 adsorption protein A [Paraburkholderia sp.]MDE1180693.1 bacteriophage N4 adsorption protein A [Paraburkholderia sp.]